MSSPVERSYDIRQNHPWHPEDRKAKVAVESAIGGGMISGTDPQTLGRVKVPQATYKGPDTSFISSNKPAVYQSTEGARGLGIPLTECRTLASSGRSDMQAQAFQELSQKTIKIKLRINWPGGYEEYGSGQYTVKNTKGIISKAKLAEIVALEVEKIIKDRSLIVKGYAVVDPLWKLGDDGIRFEELFLTEIRHVSKASLQPHFEVVRVHRA
ncbi:hypothetical protein IEO21_02926 [Rhodonia placenta]|uniref:Uncharacterized protein n=1 Tax=Rhodonia placenta TaxID=104341 RepID=A0A8H7U425_9APHY|nr:hypothetical protein IEO21_02926 [Postia placenta]